MGDNSSSTHYIENDLSTRWPTHQILSTGVTAEVVTFYAQRASEMKIKVDHLGAEVSQRQDKMRLINDIISEINSLTDDNNGLDIQTQEKLQEKLSTARSLGVKIPENQLKFNAIQRDRLIENLHLTADSWDKENKSQTQKMEIYIKELDRVLMLLKEVQKSEKQPKQASLAGMKGG